VHERGTLDEETLSRLEVLRVGRPGSRLSLDQDGMQAVLDAMKDGLLDWFATRYDLKDEPPSAASTT
jgi:hypothetical protein